MDKYYYFFDGTGDFCESNIPFKTPKARPISKEIYDKLAQAAQERQEIEEERQLPILIAQLEQQARDLADRIKELTLKVDIEDLLRARKEFNNGNN